MTPQRFKEIRKAHRLTLDETCTLLGISDRSTITRYAAGTRAISGPVARLMELFDMGVIDREGRPARWRTFTA